MDFARVLRLLDENEVDFIIVEGVAAAIQGSSRLTQDLDVVYDRSPPNVERLALAFDDLWPYPRGAPPGLPFDWSAATLQAGLNFTLQTDAGPVDLFGEIAGGGDYESLIEKTEEVEVFGFTCRCLNLDTLIQTKRAAGRPRDLEAIAELEVIRETRRED